ncbi:MAG: glutamine-hydrolyzing GMP synthase [Spirochaetaceae bacterium]|jgi:GMP synthase (glutamine-hydrolysing)|nr:glutamine-hydrolyzing GMP synthase [Spirochaetaceae bacterium]
MEKIVILDFGSQTTALIGRRIRDLGVYSEIIPGDSDMAAVDLRGVKGLIFSGSPESVYANGAKADPSVYTCGLPLLGICYGLQRMTIDQGGEVAPLPTREFGPVPVTLTLEEASGEPPEAAAAFFAAFFAAISVPASDSLPPSLFPPTEANPDRTFTAWMSHGDTLTRLAPGFVQCGTSGSGYPAIVYHREKPWFGFQFHPEATHCEYGNALLGAFVFGVCGAQGGWSMENYLAELREEIRLKAGNKTVLLLISGGVDSSVTAALLLKSLPAEAVHLMYVDTGLMRKNETEEVEAALKKLGAKHLHIIRAEDAFLAALAGKEQPEEKRAIIGDLFITIQEREVARLGLPPDYLLAQGTLYTDLIESGKGVGNKAHVIKSHHNVASPLVAALRREGRIIEPLEKLYKDEARALGRLVSLDETIIGRHPFPGPGLAVRILGAVTKEKCAILREADALYIGELRARGLYDQIWQAFAVLLPVRSVGVAGDERRYGSVLTLRAVTSADGMTADVFPFPPEDLLEIAALITNTIHDIGRVTYDISSKPPATIEWE